MQREQYRIDARNYLQLDSLDPDDNIGHPLATGKDIHQVRRYIPDSYRHPVSDDITHAIGRMEKN